MGPRAVALQFNDFFLIRIFPEIAYKPSSRPNPPTDLGIPSMGIIFRAESESGGPRGAPGGPGGGPGAPAAAPGAPVLV